jgi:NodT family efflux transporter outer membrane factor (OMF) lipoprotein
MSFFRPSRPIAGLAAASGLALLTACAPDLGPAARIKPATDYAVARTLQTPSAGAWPGLDWWTAYNDPQLTQLIEEALKGAPDLRIAQARVRQAAAQAEQTRAPLWPSVNAKASVEPTAVDINGFPVPGALKSYLPKDGQPITQLSASLAYQIDFFGRNRAAVAAASSDSQAAQFELAAGRLQLSTAVATAYANLVRLAADRQAAVDAVRVRSDSLQLVSNRLLNGLENRSQLDQSSAEARVSQGDVAAIDAQIEVARHELASLVGAGPDRGLDVTPNLESIREPWGLPSNLPADLIGRRPDVAAARLRAEAAASRIKQARADFYPNISLSASAQEVALTPDQLLRKNLIFGQVGPAISLPLFEGGRLEGAYRGARGNYDEAVANYDKTVVQALREVADAVSTQKALLIQLGYAQKAAADSQKAFDLATLRYKGGLSPYLAVLTAEATLVAQRRAEADLSAQTLANNIALVRALGGGFIDPAARPATASTQQSNPEGPSHG